MYKFVLKVVFGGVIVQIGFVFRMPFMFSVAESYRKTGTSARNVKKSTARLAGQDKPDVRISEIGFQGLVWFRKTKARSMKKERKKDVHKRGYCICSKGF